MTRTFAAAILAASLGFAPTAQADRLLYRLPDGASQPTTQGGGTGAAQVLGGLAVLGALGYTLNRLSDDDDHDDGRREIRRHGHHGWNGERNFRRGSGLPSNCQRRVQTRYGSGRVVGTDCLYRNGVNVSRLPRECRTRVYAGGRRHRAFDAGCLRHNGWGTARHR